MTTITLYTGTQANISLFGTTAADPTDATKTIRTFHFDAIPMAIGAMAGSFFQAKADNKWNAANGYEVANPKFMQCVIPFMKKG
jgi:hypothetical protein